MDVSICPLFPPIILAFEYDSIFDIYVEAGSYHMSCINHDNKLISLSISAKISRWNGGRANIPTPYIYNDSLSKVAFHFLHHSFTLQQLAC